MTPIKNIKLSYRCREDLNLMTPDSRGLHCSNCNKTVIDFRNKDRSELVKALKEHGTVCGLFSNNQMAQDKGWIKILRRYATSLLVAIGLSAFNKEFKAQSKSCDSSDSSQSHANDHNKCFLGTFEQQPKYKYGGINGLFEFISKNFKYPSTCGQVQGKVMVQFTVDTAGNVKDAKILRGLSEAADKEVLRVVELTEWIPATQGEKKIKTQMVIPVNFRLDNDKKKKTRKRQKQ